MTRYYTRSGTYKHGLIADRVVEVFVLFWNAKEKKHSFVSVDGVRAYPDYCWGEYVTFECEAHEKEFLEFHPDAKEMRRAYRYGYFYGCSPVAHSETEIPFEYRRGRWCWKKR